MMQRNSGMGEQTVSLPWTRLKSKVFQHRRLGIIGLEVLLVVLGYALAFGLRFDFHVPEASTAVFLRTLPYLLLCRAVTYFMFKLHSGWWRLVGMVDLEYLTKAIFSGTILFILGLVFFYGFEGFPRSVIVLEAMLSFGFMGGIRFTVRWLRETVSGARPKQFKDVLIVGAGKAGTQLLQEIRTHPQLGIRVRGFIDDDPKKQNAVIQGVKVLGTCDQITALGKRLSIDEIFITIPCAGYRKISDIVHRAKQSDIKAKVLPSMSQLIDKDGLWQRLREVPYDELLGRPVLKFRRESDLQLLKDEIGGKVVLVTGAGGSIGSELCRQVARLGPRTLVLYERSETALYYLELDLCRAERSCRIVPVLGDLLDREKFDRVVKQHGVELIYHAAAYKHVPMMQREPLEAVRNNVLATQMLVETALANRVKKCVYISTDKAVRPSNIMGATKRVGEMIMQANAHQGTKFIAVRFGNVIGSNGSVIPLFKRQIARGGPVTVTHPEASRYFMAISEAVQLVLTAGAMGQGGEIFLLDMGEPVKILDLAHRLIRSSGLEPGKDIEIRFIGLRPGEKLHEELYWQGENVVPTTNKKITRLRANGFDPQVLYAQLCRLQSAVEDREEEMVSEILEKLVQEETCYEATPASGVTVVEVQPAPM